MPHTPSYIRLHAEGIIGERLVELKTLVRPCRLCPRQCGADRAAGDRGYCNASYEAYVSSAAPHFGEETPLVGTSGSGTIFMTHCNLRCVFCQNYEISIRGEGVRCDSGVLSDIMVDLQERGCHNINFVTPTHYIHEIVSALPRAIENGLTVPLVYNTSGYDSKEVIRLLEGIFEIYMPDIKFMNADLASRYCRAQDYPEIIAGVVKEMFRQVGDLTLDSRGIAQKGLIIRHLQMPNSLEDTRKVLDFIAGNISHDAFVNIMAQYHPFHRADEYPELVQKVDALEHREALEHARSIGLNRVFHH